MAYKIKITAPALRDIDQAADFYEAEGSDKVAEKWLDGLDAEIRALEDMPRSCPFAIENDDVEFELRERAYKSHRILFTITEDSVFVLRVYHMARKLLDRSSLGSIDG